MAKKAVASLQTGKGKHFTKCIKMVKSSKSNGFEFKEEVVHIDNVKNFFSDK